MSSHSLSACGTAGKRGQMEPGALPAPGADLQCFLGQIHEPEIPGWGPFLEPPTPQAHWERSCNGGACALHMCLHMDFPMSI